MRFFYTVTLFLTFLQPFQSLNSQVCINEYLSLNINGILDEDHTYSDWIEIYNNSDIPANITGFGLSDDPSIVKWTFPAAVLPARKHLLIFASGKDRKQLSMNFETIIDVGEDWRYLVPSADIGSAWKSTGFDDSSWQSGSSSFGYSDNDDSTLISTSALSLFIRREFTVTNLADMARLVLTIDYDDGFVAWINGHEVARSNLGNPGENTPWDQLATNSHEAVMYSGGNPEYFEVSNPASVLVEGTNVIAIQVHNNIVSSSDLTLVPFLTIGRMSEGISDISQWLSFPTYGGLHTNFKMDVDSESVYLFNPQGALVDSTPHMNMIRDVSFGRKADGSAIWNFFGAPTPGSTNCNPVTNLMADSVIFSPEGGIHPGSVLITLSCAGGSNDSVYYTLDGSIPDKTDNLYTGPFTLSSSKVIRARSIRHDRLPGPVSSRTYVTALDHDLPVICLSTEPFNLWDNLAGIYTFGPNTPTQMPYYEANYWKEWERPVHIELYDTDGIRQIDQDAGMKIFGGWSRTAPQKSLALFARKDYGKGSFKYRFFKTRSNEKFESLVLRNSGNDNMGLQFHDCFMTGLARDMDVDVQAYQPAAIYLNGEYWGLLNIREKISDHYVAGNHLVDADSVNLLEYDGQILNGTNTRYLALRDFMNQKSTLQNDADFNKVSEQIDIDNFIQYQLLNIYLNNRDWPGNNIKYWNT
ncbi:MAG TPA: CotH kinase family protein, partial [Bacteroidales bacterium]|nr:CotH kinase family protein [Bacteroidales bacterium]